MSGVSKAIRELRALSELNVSFIMQVDNEILDEAVNRITHIQAASKNERVDKMYIRCVRTRVDGNVFAEKYPGTIASENKNVYTYKNLIFYTN